MRSRSWRVYETSSSDRPEKLHTGRSNVSRSEGVGTVHRACEAINQNSSCRSKYPLQKIGSACTSSLPKHGRGYRMAPSASRYSHSFGYYPSTPVLLEGLSRLWVTYFLRVANLRCFMLCARQAEWHHCALSKVLRSTLFHDKGVKTKETTPSRTSKHGGKNHLV